MEQKEAEDEEKYEENTMNFEGAYLSDSLADSTQIWERRCSTLKKFSQQNWLIFVQALLSYECVKNSIFLVSVKYTLVCRVSALSCTWPRDTLLCVLI